MSDGGIMPCKLNAAMRTWVLFSCLIQITLVKKCAINDITINVLLLYENVVSRLNLQ